MLQISIIKLVSAPVEFTSANTSDLSSSVKIRQACILKIFHTGQIICLKSSDDASISKFREQNLIMYSWAHISISWSNKLSEPAEIIKSVKLSGISF